MILQTDSTKRAAIFAFYDKDGIADDYIFVLLREMKKHCHTLLAVVNGTLTEESEQKLRQTGAEILFRENTGMDIYGYRAGILHMKDTLAEFDETVLFNQTIFGPVYPFSEMFDAMNEKDIDFWGITKHPGIDEDPWGTVGKDAVPSHLQSYFVAIRKNMFTADAFFNYWENLLSIESYHDAVGGHEVQFTEKFEALGFVSGVYIDIEKQLPFYDYPLIISAYTMAVQYCCPVIKRKAFCVNKVEYLVKTAYNESAELFAWLQNNSSYDVRLILQNIIRTEYYYDILMSISEVQIVEESDVSKGKPPLYIMVYNNMLTEEFAKLLAQDDVVAVFENEEAKNKYTQHAKTGTELSNFSLQALLRHALINQREKEEICILTNLQNTLRNRKEEKVAYQVDYTLFKEAVLVIKSAFYTKAWKETTGAIIPQPPLHGMSITDMYLYDEMKDEDGDATPFLCKSRCFILKKHIAQTLLETLPPEYNLNEKGAILLPATACKQASLIVDTVITSRVAQSMLMSAKYMVDGISAVWATQYKKNYPQLISRMQTVLDFFNERRYKMTLEQAIKGNLSFKEKMWITLQLFLKPSTFEKLRKVFSGGKPPAEEIHERDSID